MGDGAVGRLTAAKDALAETKPFDAETIESVLGSVLEREQLRPKQLYQPLRVAITGTVVSPGIFESLAALGREETVARVKAALARLAARRA